MFILEGKELALDPNLIATVLEFRLIWERDKTPEKDEAMATFTFIYHFINPRSPYHGLSAQDRKKKVMDDYFPPSLKGWDLLKDKLVQLAIDGYAKYLNFAPERFLLDAAEEAVHAVAKELREKPKMKNKTQKLQEMTKQMETVKKLRKDVEEAEGVRKQLTSGDREISPREDPDYKIMFVPKTNLRPKLLKT
jgi:hypothetical protein